MMLFLTVILTTNYSKVKNDHYQFGVKNNRLTIPPQVWECRLMFRADPLPLLP